MPICHFSQQPTPERDGVDERIVYASEADLTRFLAGESAMLPFSDAEGSGMVSWYDEAALEFSQAEVEELRGPGKSFWVDHPTSGKQISVRIKVGPGAPQRTTAVEG